jgi:hypothetical protein
MEVSEAVAKFTRPPKNYLGFGLLRRSGSCIHALVRCHRRVNTGSCASAIKLLVHRS